MFAFGPFFFLLSCNSHQVILALGLVYIQQFLYKPRTQRMLLCVQETGAALHFVTLQYVVTAVAYHSGSAVLILKCFSVVTG